MSGLAWSFGGGTQSVAIAVLVAQGKLPRPDHIVIADTGRETRATWEYLDAHVRRLLAPSEVVIAGHDLSTVDLYSHKGSLLLPAFTRRNGTVGSLPTYCSSEWKRAVIRRWLRAHGYGPKNPVDLWLGMSTDEVHRAKDSVTPWITNRFPLLFDVPLSRAECILLVESAGLPTPPRSACWLCPFRRDREWAELRDERPDEWRKAIEADRAIRERDPHVYLHRSGVPLDEAVLATPEPGLWDEDGCNTGFCFV